MRILISAAGSAASPTIIKYIKSLGHSVIGIDSSNESKMYAQTYCDEFIKCPLAQQPNFIHFINSIGDKFDLYIPYIDEEIIALSQSDKIQTAIKEKIILCPKETIEICTDKKKFQNHCELNNLPVAPRTDDAPAVYKPQFGRGSKGIIYVEHNDLIYCFRNMNGILQKYIKGTEYTVDVLVDKQGEWQFAVARKRLETAGVSRIGEIHQHPKVLDYARLCANKIIFAGPVNMQFIVDSHDNVYLIEINPRLSGSILFTVYGGFDVLAIIPLLWLGYKYDLPKNEEINSNRYIRYWQHHIC